MVDGIMKKIHEDVVICILLGLPVKSLMRLKCISKTLYTLVQSSTFINLHLNRTTTYNDELIFFKRSIKLEPDLFKNILSFLSSDNKDDLNPVSPDIDVPYLTSDYCSRFHQLIGPCRGLIALTDFTTIVLLNPATRKYRLLPGSSFVCPKGFTFVTRGVGFGHSTAENYYKLVRIFEVYTDPYDRDLDARHSKVEVYDSCTDCWRDLDLTVKLLPKVRRFASSEIFYKETFHWCAHDDTVMILCFDISLETFHYMKLPDHCHFWDNKGYGLTVLSNYLTFITYPNPRCALDPGQEFTDIWIMEEYGVNGTWIKKYTIKPLPIESSLSIWKDHLLLLQTTRGTLSSYNLSSDELKEFNFQGFTSTLRLVVYKESSTIIPRESEHGTRVQTF
uniref:S6a-locus F-box type-11 protein n=1 Tax=Petunia integrifolia subsp. inflata TaxID=212142 RepID=A0A076YL61_PETIN|nr:S6a-locus F-box type-11 protein [Petunia integrifolia subsp. inflata]